MDVVGFIVCVDALQHPLPFESYSTGRRVYSIKYSHYQKYLSWLQIIIFEKNRIKLPGKNPKNLRTGDFVIFYQNNYFGKIALKNIAMLPMAAHIWHLELLVPVTFGSNLVYTPRGVLTMLFQLSLSLHPDSTSYEVHCSQGHLVVHICTTQIHNRFQFRCSNTMQSKTALCPPTPPPL